MPDLELEVSIAVLSHGLCSLGVYSTPSIINNFTVNVRVWFSVASLSKGQWSYRNRKICGRIHVSVRDVNSVIEYMHVRT